MSAAEELAKMQEEWREEVRQSFKRLEASLQDYNKRVSRVEGNQNKLFGGLVVIQAIGSWLFSKFTNHHT